ncbi:MAGUK p55 subfamily member 6 [Galendromus occidentalis]|uniref:MAGUK p55 subfamily member 6 n=1 Tax=Galendromus occidentalis TaxID=34638 RepID=A0AAJ7SGA9_9ACAR|nr:MAGUK p55 subfamily member 6 [Galendromus occidentalis]
MVLFNAILGTQDRRRLLRSMEQLDKPSTSGYSGRDNPGYPEDPEENSKTIERIEVVTRELRIHTRTESKPGGPLSSSLQADLSKGPTTAHVKTVEIARDVARQCRANKYNKEAQELAKILGSPHVDNLLDAHDQVALMTLRKQADDEKVQESATETEDESFDKNQPETSSDDEDEQDTSQDSLATESLKVVVVRKVDGEPLGITVDACPESGRVRIARILAGGLIEKQGMLHVGDKIVEVNNVRTSTAENLQIMLRKAKPGALVFKVIPSPHDTSMHSNSFVKTLYSYDPSKDTLLPCKDIGLAFSMGDILQILNTQDPNWWQARKLGTRGHAGLIPSQELEERRRAFVPAEFDYATTTTMCGTKLTRHKRKTFYETRLADEFEKAELALYEEVTKVPPFERKTLVLVGASGVGRRSLRNQLIDEHPGLFGVPLPHTSRPIREDEIDGKVYHFVSREQMEADIADNKYLEWGEFGGHLYGTKLDSIREIMSRDKMVILDCSPQYLKILKSPEFMSYVVFVAAPPMPELRGLYDGNRYGSKYGRLDLNLTFDRAMSRQSRRALTLQSLASLQEDEDLKRTIDESARLERQFAAHFDATIVNHAFDKTYDQLKDLIEQTRTEPQWVPVSWVF